MPRVQIPLVLPGHVQWKDDGWVLPIAGVSRVQKVVRIGQA